MKTPGCRLSLISIEAVNQALEMHRDQLATGVRHREGNSIVRAGFGPWRLVPGQFDGVLRLEIYIRSGQVEGLGHTPRLLDGTRLTVDVRTGFTAGCSGTPCLSFIPDGGGSFCRPVGLRPQSPDGAERDAEVRAYLAGR